MQLPAIRKLILPEPDHIIFDCDMAGADAQVVAWEAKDEDLKDAFRKGLKIHKKNFEDFWQKPFLEKYKYEIQPGHIYSPYDEMKRAVHATNYAASARTVAATLQWSTNQANDFQNRWFKLHPGIKQWHQRIERDLQHTRTVKNAFDYRITYFGRTAEVLPQALAWIPQSTVGLLAARAAIKLDSRFGYKAVRDGKISRRLATISLQVHDSLVFQIHKSDYRILPYIKAALHQPVPYPEPIHIQWSIAASTKSWGDVKEIRWDTPIHEIS